MVDYGPQTPMNTTTVATALQRIWACHTRTVLPSDAYGRQRYNIVLCVFCCLPVVYVLGCVLVREGKKTDKKLPVCTYKIGPEKPGKSFIHSRRKKTLRAPCASYSARIEFKPRPQVPNGLPVSMYFAFWLEVLVRRDMIRNRRKFHKYTYSCGLPEFKRNELRNTRAA